MPESTTPRSALATVVGWAIVAVIVWLVLTTALGAIFWMVRSLLWVVILGGLIWAYLSLKAPREE
jgi:hypothetical protein